MVGAIITFDVVVPVVQGAINASSLSGTNLTMANIIIPLIIVVLIVSIVSMVSGQ